MGRSFFKLLDFLLDHWDQFAWLVPGAALLSAWVMGRWAALSALHSVEIVTIALVVTAAMLAILTLLPQYLRQKFPRPFAVSVSSMLTQAGTLYNNVHLYAFILNRSPKNRVVLDFAFCFRSKSGKENWSDQPTLKDITPGLDPEGHTVGTISFNIAPVGNLILSEPDGVIIHTSNRTVSKETPSNTNLDGEMYLQIVGRLSGRWARFRVPGSYPLDFFVLK